MTLTDQFRNVNWRDPGTLPAAPKLSILGTLLLAVVIGGYVIDWRGQFDDLDAGQATETRLKADYVRKTQQAVNLEAYERQYKEVETTFGTLLKQLPNKQQIEALLVEINQAGLGRGLQFELFKPSSELVHDFYAELPIRLKVTGTYHDMGGFAADVAQLSRIVTLTDLALVSTKESGLTLETTAKTYRYLDDDEVAAQKKLQAAARAKK